VAGFFCVLASGDPIPNLLRISLIFGMIIGAFSRVHAMPHQQDVAHIVPVCSGALMIVAMLDANGDPIKRQIKCPDCISVLALSDITSGAAILHHSNAKANQYWTAHAQCASVLFDGFDQRAPPIQS
jgi:hypothetical protein